MTAPDGVATGEARSFPLERSSLAEEIADEVLEGIPLEDDPAVRQSLKGRLEMVVAQVQSPVPPPFMLRDYNEILPGSAERMFKEAEAQAGHRRALESRVVKGSDRRANLGQFLGFGIAVLFGLGSWDLIKSGHEVAGVFLGTIDLVALVSVFVFSQDRQAGGAAAQRSETQPT